VSLFNLFKKSKWSKLKKSDPSVQQDVAYLIALDALIKYGIRNAVDKFTESFNTTSDETNKALCYQLEKQEFVNELELALLSTGVGKVFPEISWNKFKSESVIKFLGSLVMCEFRCGEELSVENDITKSGFSYSSNESRAQFLILLSNAAGVKDTSAIKLFDIEHFNEFWFELKNLIFVSLQKNVAAEGKGLTSVVRERFEMLSESRQEALLVIAALDYSQDKKTNNSATSRSEEPFDLEKYMQEHPYLFIPHTKISKLIEDMSELAKKFLFFELEVDEYELRRVAGLKNEVSSDIIPTIIYFDFGVLFYCGTVAVIRSKESDFGGSAVVWKAITNKYQEKYRALFQIMGGLKINGTIDQGFMSGGTREEYSFPGADLDLVSSIRCTSAEFLKTPGDSLSRLKVLTRGTVALCGLLSHPKYSDSLLEFINLALKKVDKETTEFAKGELISYEEQKELT